MSNSQTEHSKALRARTAAEWQKKQIAEGKKKRILLMLDTELAEAFDKLGETWGASRPQTLKALIEFYHAHQ